MNVNRATGAMSWRGLLVCRRNPATNRSAERCVCPTWKSLAGTFHSPVKDPLLPCEWTPTFHKAQKVTIGQALGSNFAHLSDSEPYKRNYVRSKHPHSRRNIPNVHERFPALHFRNTVQRRDWLWSPLGAIPRNQRGGTTRLMGCPDAPPSRGCCAPMSGT